MISKAHNTFFKIYRVLLVGNDCASVLTIRVGTVYGRGFLKRVGGLNESLN